MSNHLHKSAAVLFVNQRGERSMKRVKVPRYFAGKRPAYATEEDEEEYVTDEENDEENECNSDEQYDEEDEEEDEYRVATSSNKNLEHLGADADEESSSDESDRNRSSPNRAGPNIAGHDTKEIEDVDDEDDDEDPRFRRLKQIEAKTNPSRSIDNHRTQQIASRYDLSRANVILDEDDDEDEVRQRHALAKTRKVDAPLGPQAILGTSVVGAQQELTNEEDDDEESTRTSKRLDTEDILKDLKLTGISRPVRERQKTEEDQEAESRRLKELLDQAKQEASLTSQTYKKVEEDIRRDREREALAKGDIMAREMSSVITDDDDEELAYEEWKFREIKRVQRDRSERVLLAATRVR